MTTTPLDQSAYAAGWQASHEGQRAQVPTEWLATDAQIDGWIWGWIDYVLAMGRKQNGAQIQSVSEEYSVFGD